VTTSEIFPYRKALKFYGETIGMRCASGKVKLPQLAAPAEPLNALFSGNMPESKRFFIKH